MQISSSSSSSSSSAAAASTTKLEFLPLSNSNDAERGLEERQLSDPSIKILKNETFQSSTQQNIDSAMRMMQNTEDVEGLRAEQISQQLRQTESNVLNHLDLIRSNINRIYGQCSQLDPKILCLAFSACVVSLSFSIYENGFLQGKSNHQSTKILASLWGQLNSYPYTQLKISGFGAPSVDPEQRQ
ncbi:hypothetical protein KMZ15_06440 [Mycoavidus sp. HKI]|uniref:hypothetical protein n=1 Tax=Mycoavidus sp. HKI TaxID=2840467 RepID=UPI001CBDE768|nr:hypothetical protein [Mycoavidus sp. HKI]UAW63711.1 hypothetical protein KMZ15_06440 [Mycoavidus sp. HKI]